MIPAHRLTAWVILRAIVNPPVLMRRLLPALLPIVALLLTACGGDDETAATETTATKTTAPGFATAYGDTTVYAPPAKANLLAANAAEVGRIVGDGESALKTRLARLKGHPVVVNQWASWCPPCAAEFPFFTKAATAYSNTVAFVGIDFRDDRASAKAFLRDQAAGFPSVFDPDGDATRSLGGGRVSPSTFFIAADGKVTHTKPGAYADYAQLDADIRRHALGRK